MVVMKNRVNRKVVLLVGSFSTRPRTKMTMRMRTMTIRTRKKIKKMQMKKVNRKKASRETFVSCLSNIYIVCEGWRRRVNAIDTVG